MVDRDSKRFSAFLRKQEAAAAHKRAILLCSSNLQQFGSLQHFTSSPASPERTIRPHTAVSLAPSSPIFRSRFQSLPVGSIEAPIFRSRFQSLPDGSIKEISDSPLQHTPHQCRGSESPGALLGSRRGLLLEIICPGEDTFRSELSEPLQQSSQKRSCSAYSNVFSPKFKERNEAAIQLYVAKKSGLVNPRTNLEKQFQSGATLSPLLDPASPLYNRPDFVQERKRIVGRSTPTVTWREIEKFTSRQQDSTLAKEDSILRISHEYIEKFKGLNPAAQIRFTPQSLQAFVERVGPKASSLKRKEELAKAHEKIEKSLSWTPGVTPKKCNLQSEEFRSFIERQQEVMRTRERLANKFFGQYD